MRCLLLLLALAGCERSDPVGDRTVTVFTDPLTGCQYLSHDGLTPRLDRDGKPVCGPPIKETISWET